MKIIAQNCTDAKVNVFVTYGSMGYPKNYLGIYKNFNFIEKTGSVPTKLRLSKNPNKPQYDDLLERVMQDTNAQPQSDGVASATPVNDWL